MKRLLTFVFVLTLTILISSCATVHPNQKLLIGTWRTVNVERYNIPNLSSLPAANAQKSKTIAGQASDSASAAKQAAKAEERLHKLIQTEARTTLTIKANKTAIIEFPGKTIHGTWKLSKNGKRLNVSSKEVDRKLDIELLQISDTSAVAIESLPVGGLKVTYKKVKK